MDSNLCEYIQGTINIQYIIRQLLRMANDQIDCSADDCIDNIDNPNQNQIDDNLRQIDHGIGSTSLTFGFILFAFLLLWFVLPQQQRQPNDDNQQRR
ncbi:hypothetical protein BLA29_014697, partial [Euroglyphus maynei]